jgi:hypothetical protein
MNVIVSKPFSGSARAVLDADPLPSQLQTWLFAAAPSRPAHENYCGHVAAAWSPVFEEYVVKVFMWVSCWHAGDALQAITWRLGIA